MPRVLGTNQASSNSVIWLVSFSDRGDGGLKKLAGLGRRGSGLCLRRRRFRPNDFDQLSIQRFPIPFECVGLFANNAKWRLRRRIGAARTLDRALGQI